MTLRTQKNNDSVIFDMVLVLLFFSFFEESVLSCLSTVAMVAMFILPLIILCWLILYRISFNKADKLIFYSFMLVILVQMCGINIDRLYKSFTSIYRSCTALIVIMYIRHITIDSKKFNSFLILSAMEILLGFLSIILPKMPNGNILYGNPNTVGVLFFSLFVLNGLAYLRTKKIDFLWLAIFDVILISISLTRVALFLVLLILLLFGLFKMMNIKRMMPTIFYITMFVFLIGFVICYYHIKESSLYEIFNQLSMKLFNKNFDSGRPDLWHYSVKVVGSKVAFGLGSGVNLEDLVPYVKTSHSVYFEVYLQNGMVGLIIFMASMLICLKTKGEIVRAGGRGGYINVFMMITAVMIIFYNAVGIVLIKPRSGVGILHWAILALPYCNSKFNVIKRVSVRNDKFDSSCIQRTIIH